MDDIGDDFSELNAGSDSDSDENSDNKGDHNGINNTEINNHEEDNEPEVILIQPRITHSTNQQVNSIDSAFDESNFDPAQDLSEETLVMGLLEPKMKGQAEKRIEWTSKQPISAGCRGHQNVICERLGPMV